VKRENHCTGMNLLTLVSLVFVCVAASGCGILGHLGLYSLDDEELEPFAAMYEVDRERFCLTEIDRDSRVEVEWDLQRSYGYDVMLHMYGDRVSRMVSFIQEDGQYVWIGEQEVHYSGRTFMTPDGEVREHIAVVCDDSAHGSSGMLEVRIFYIGGYEDIPRQPTCEQASAIIKKWNTDGMAVDED
jgi:hypothetical protein